jgi:hypothetical protein
MSEPNDRCSRVTEEWRVCLQYDVKRILMTSTVGTDEIGRWSSVSLSQGYRFLCTALSQKSCSS